MSFDFQNYQPLGDKKNSDEFNEYRLKIYDWRTQNGLNELIKHIRALVLQVETGQAVDYLVELCMMTPYRFAAGYETETHRVYILTNMHGDEMPAYMVLEPLHADYVDENTRLNCLQEISRKKPNARYIGELFQSSDVKEVTKLLSSHDIAFNYEGESANSLYANKHFTFTLPSPYTHNRFGYTHCDLCDFDALQIGKRFELPDEAKAKIDKMDAFYHEKGLDKLILGVDHMATRVLSSNREPALLEFLTCSDYYFWGAYNISEMNSSTNVNRNPFVDTDRKSPAKVFTANNTPYFVNAFGGSPMPTEEFVLNLGPRMHHIAQEVKDGDHGGGEKNIDYVVNTIKGEGVPFLAHIVGECKDDPNLKQIFSKRSHYSMLITEYIERCHGYEGFFTKSNVAALTAAAGQDEIAQHGQVFD